MRQLWINSRKLVVCDASSSEAAENEGVPKTVGSQWECCAIFLARTEPITEQLMIFGSHPGWSIYPTESLTPCISFSSNSLLPLILHCGSLVSYIFVQQQIQD